MNYWLAWSSVAGPSVPESRERYFLTTNSTRWWMVPRTFAGEVPSWWIQLTGECECVRDTVSLTHTFSWLLCSVQGYPAATAQASGGHTPEHSFPQSVSDPCTVNTRQWPNMWQYYHHNTDNNISYLLNTSQNTTKIFFPTNKVSKIFPTPTSDQRELSVI